MGRTRTHRTHVLIPTPDGQMPAALFVPEEGDRQPAILLLMEAFGVTSHIRRRLTIPEAIHFAGVLPPVLRAIFVADRSRVGSVAQPSP